MDANLKKVKVDILYCRIIEQLRDTAFEALGT